MSPKRAAKKPKVEQQPEQGPAMRKEYVRYLESIAFASIYETAVNRGYSVKTIGQDAAAHRERMSYVYFNLAGTPGVLTADDVSDIHKAISELVSGELNGGDSVYEALLMTEPEVVYKSDDDEIVVHAWVKRMSCDCVVTASF